MQVWNVLQVARWKYRTQNLAKKSPSGHHCTTLSGYIFAIKARIDNRKKNLLSSNISTCLHNMVNFIGHKPNCVALNRGHHLYSAGRPSRWALAHILFTDYFGGPCRAIGPLRAFVSLQTVTFKRNDRWPRYWTCSFTLTLSWSRLKVNVLDQSSGLRLGLQCRLWVEASLLCVRSLYL